MRDEDVIITELKGELKEFKETVGEQIKVLHSLLKEGADVRGAILDRMKALEVVVVGYEGKNGLRNRMETVENKTSLLESTFSKAMSKIEALFNKVDEIGDDIDSIDVRVDLLEKAKIRIYTIFTTSQFILTGIFALVLKFWTP